MKEWGVWHLRVGGVDTAIRGECSIVGGGVTCVAVDGGVGGGLRLG